ncbi:ABC-2 family transporter protein [uncultured archaeon]|nr:ABC-2 family transporter protein [uncultured archaeon]
MAEEIKGAPELTAMHNGAVERLVAPRKIWAIVQKNWMVLKGDRIRMVPMFLFPIIMIIVFGFVSGSIPKHVNAAIVDYDHSGFSYGVQKQISGMDLFAVRYTVGTQEEGKRLLDSGKIKVLFILPAGLGQKVANGQPASMQIMVDESDSSVAQMAKSSAQAFAQQLSAQVTAQRLGAVSAQAQSASADLRAAGAMSSSASNPAAFASSQDSADASWNDASYVYARANSQVQETVVGLKNSLGYLVDQNEVVGSFTPASVTSATIALLATGDQQQATLQQIASYQGLGAAQALIMRDAASIYAQYRAVSGQAAGQETASSASGRLIGSAETKLASISAAAQSATAPIGLEILEPYGYGRRGIDFLLPAILALTIFQGATMGLGRAIAGERKDGSLTRVFLTPTSNVSIIFGTQLFYMLLETVRSTFLIIVAIALFSVSISGSFLDIIFIVALFAMGATGVGMVLSVLAKNQEQYMALSMLVSLPMMFLSGVFFPVQTMPAVLQAVAGFLPLTYAADALRGVMAKGFTLAQVAPDLAVLFLFGLTMLVLSLLLFKRELA